MPLYEYYCETCGEVFSTLASIDRCRQPAPCPACGAAAARVLISAPRLNTMQSQMRRSHQINERSAHEPRVSQGHHCGPGCKHHGSQTGEADFKAQKGRRPWMLGH